MSESQLSSQNKIWKSAPVMSPDPDKKSNIVKKVEKMSFKWSRVIISGKTSILAI